MQASGHTIAHDAHPTQASGFTRPAYWYPLALTFLSTNASICCGHASMQSEHPLQRFVLTIIVPFGLLIVYFFGLAVEKTGFYRKGVLGIVIVLMIETLYVGKHFHGYGGRAIGVECYCFEVTVLCHLEISFLSPFVSFLVILVCCSMHPLNSN